MYINESLQEEMQKVKPEGFTDNVSYPIIKQKKTKQNQLKTSSS